MTPSIRDALIPALIPVIANFAIKGAVEIWHGEMIPFHAALASIIAIYFIASNKRN